MARPLKIEASDHLQEMSDADLEQLTYYLRVAYANQLNSNGDGYVFVGSGATSIGSAVDTKSTEETASQARDNSGGPDYPPAPGIGVTTVTTYNYQQDRTVPSFPSNSTLNTDGYVYQSAGNILVANSDALIYNEIIAQCITEMRTGDEVGTYRAATSSPAGTWTDKGTFFADTTFSAGTTTTKLWLKRSASVPGSTVKPLGLFSTNIKERNITETDDLVLNVLLPVLTRRLDDGDLNYTVGTSVPSNNRGSWTNTRQTGETTSQSFVNPTYFTTSTPSGTATTVTTYYLELA